MLRSAKALFGNSGDAVAPPSSRTPVAQLKPEHFVADPATLRYPSNLDFSHAAFKLRDISMLELVPKGAARVWFEQGAVQRRVAAMKS